MITRQFPRYRFFFQAGVRRRGMVRRSVDRDAACATTWQFDQVDTRGVARVAAVAALAQIGIGALAGLYVHRWRYGTFEEVAAHAAGR